MSTRALAASAAMAPGLAALAVALALEPEWSGISPASGPALLLPFGLVAACAWSLVAPLIAPRPSVWHWLTSGALAAGVFAPVIAAGARLAFADASMIGYAALRIAALWIFASGAAAVLVHSSPRRGRAHYSLLAGLACLASPLLDYLAIEPLAAPRLLPAGLSPFEWLYRLDPGTPPAPGAWILPVAAPAAFGAGALFIAARLGARRATTASIAALLGVLAAPALRAQPSASVARVVPLLAPYYRPGEAYPLAVQVAAGATAWSGTVELAWGPRRLRETVTIGASATRTLWFYPQAGAHGEVHAFAISIVLTPSDPTAPGTSNAPHTATLSARRVYAIDQLIGVIGPRAGQLEYFSHLPGERTRIAVEIAELPDRARGLDPLDLVVLGAQTRSLPVDSPGARALRGYVAAGGAVLVADREVARNAELAFLFPGGKVPRWPEDPTIARPGAPQPGEFYGPVIGSPLVYLLGAHGRPPAQIGRGRGVLLADDGALSAENLRWEGTPKLWSFLDSYAGTVRRRPAPWAGDPAELSGMIRPRGDPGRATPELPRQLYAALLAVAGGALLLASRASGTARLAAPVFALATGAAGAMLALGTIPAGTVSVRGIARVEVALDQESGEASVALAVDARRDAELSVGIDATVDAVRAVGDASLTVSVAERAWSLELDLRRGEYRLVAARWPASIGPSSTAGFGDDAVWLNRSAHGLVAPAVFEGGRFHRLDVAVIAPGGAARFAGRREVPRADLARAMFPDLAEPDRAFDWLFAGRTLAGARLALARIDLPPPPLSAEGLLPPRPVPTLLMLTLPDR